MEDSTKKIKKDDKGNPWGCAIFQYFKAMAPEIADDLEIVCQKGGIGCAEDKKRLIKIANNFLDPIRKRREEYEKNPDLIKEILINGNKKAREVGKKTMQAVHAAMHIDYKKILGE